MANEQNQREIPSETSDDSSTPSIKKAPIVRLRRGSNALLEKLASKHGLTKSGTIDIALRLLEDAAAGRLDVTLPALTQEVIGLDHSVGLLAEQLEHLEGLRGVIIACGHEQGKDE